jgi:hypothetical protein
MPLRSKDNGPELKPGDYVKMEWVISRVYDVDVVQVTRSGAAGRSAASPQVVTVRMGTGKSALKLLPTNAPLAPGTRCLLLWRVAQVYPSTGTVLVQRSGASASGTPAVPATALVTAGALASELEYVPPEDVKPPLPLAAGSAAPRVSESFEPALVDALPYGFEVGAYNWGDQADGLPSLTALEPTSATIGDPGFTLRVLGDKFTVATTVRWNGVPQPTTFVSPTELTVPVAMTAALEPMEVTVDVQQGGGPISNPLTFTLLSMAPVAG